MANAKKPSWTWAFEEGILTVDHQGERVSLGRYANQEYAAKAAALYIAKHDDPATLPPGKAQGR